MRAWRGAPAPAHRHCRHLAPAPPLPLLHPPLHPARLITTLSSLAPYPHHNPILTCTQSSACQPVRGGGGCGRVRAAHRGQRASQVHPRARWVGGRACGWVVGGWGGGCLWTGGGGGAPPPVNERRVADLGAPPPLPPQRCSSGGWCWCATSSPPTCEGCRARPWCWQRPAPTAARCAAAGCVWLWLPAHPTTPLLARLASLGPHQLGRPAP